MSDPPPFRLDCCAPTENLIPLPPTKIGILFSSSAIPANALILSSYKTTNPSLLRRRSPTILAKCRSDYSSKKGPEIVEPCFIHEDAQVDASAKIGPNVSIGQGVKIGPGCRVKESILLDNTVLDVSVSSSSRNGK